MWKAHDVGVFYTSMLLMQSNAPPFVRLPPAPGATFEPGGRYTDELSIDRIKAEKVEAELKRDPSGFNWAASFRDLNQLLSRQQEMAPRRDLAHLPGVRPMNEQELRHLEMEMEVLRARQAKKVEAERRKELSRRNSTENAGKTAENGGKLPDYMLPMSPPGKQPLRAMGPLNVSLHCGCVAE